MSPELPGNVPAAFGLFNIDDWSEPEQRAETKLIHFLKKKTIKVIRGQDKLFHFPKLACALYLYK